MLFSEVLHKVTSFDVDAAENARHFIVIELVPRLPRRLRFRYQLHRLQDEVAQRWLNERCLGSACHPMIKTDRRGLLSCGFRGIEVVGIARSVQPQGLSCRREPKTNEPASRLLRNWVSRSAWWNGVCEGRSKLGNPFG
jgi:hypothetical protein